jgi:hypothetical protein
MKDIFTPQDKSRWEGSDHAGVRQDKNALSRVRVARPQPVTPPEDKRTLPPNGNTQRLPTQHSTRRKREYVMLWVEPVVKSELERRAKRNNLSLSAAGGALLKRALQENIDTEYGALLEPIIRQEIRRHLSSFSSRLALLLVRVAFAAEQTRSLVTNVLSRQPGIKEDPKILETLLDASADAAKSKITAKTPQLERVVAQVTAWFTDANQKEGRK